MNAMQRMARTGGTQTEGHPDIGAEDARQGARTGYMRRVLTVSLTLAVLVMVVLWFVFFRPTPPHPTAGASPATVAPNTNAAPGAATPVGSQ